MKAQALVKTSVQKQQESEGTIFYRTYVFLYYNDILNKIKTLLNETLWWFPLHFNSPVKIHFEEQNLTKDKPYYC